MHKLLPLLVLVLLQAAVVQAQTPTSTARPQKRLDWPRTFGGQPDFEFERTETFAEVNKEAARNGLPPVAEPKIDSLLEDTALNPLAASVPVSETTISGTDVTDTADIDHDGELPLATLLPQFEDPELGDMTEFSTSLVQAVSTFMQDWQPDLTRYSLDYMLASLKLQTVATSPTRYAVINGQRYGEGDRFQLPLKLTPTDSELVDVVERKMPTPGTLPPATMARYREVVDATIKQLQEDRQKNPERYERTVEVPVTVMEIVSRKVFVLLNGQRHELAIKYAL